ncbi:MAG: hypothetical protein OFPII_29200 [Osedax symbiont Rs1]|nr:MAG: hypothetical protein OFPII_29200 [Osedax symbiont Rs1]
MEAGGYERLLEPEIKSLVLNYLLDKNILTPSNTVFSEFTVGNATRRVDLVITKGKELWAFEIKSEADSLKRLKGQVDIYSKYFDKVFVIVAKKHVNSALSIIPKTVALWEIKENSVVVRQKGRKKLITNPDSFIDMMGVSDLSKVVNRNKLKTLSKRRKDLISSLENVNFRLLRAAAFEAITQRHQLSSKMFFDQIMSRSVTPNDIALLSRFKVQNSKPVIGDDIDDIIYGLNFMSTDYYKTLRNDWSNQSSTNDVLVTI